MTPRSDRRIPSSAVPDFLFTPPRPSYLARLPTELVVHTLRFVPRDCGTRVRALMATHHIPQWDSVAAWSTAVSKTMLSGSGSGYTNDQQKVLHLITVRSLRNRLLCAARKRKALEKPDTSRRDSGMAVAVVPTSHPRTRTRFKRKRVVQTMPLPKQHKLPVSVVSAQPLFLSAPSSPPHKRPKIHVMSLSVTVKV